MAWGVTPTGFNRKRADDILTDLNTGVEGVFPGVDLTPESPDGQFNGLMADELASVWEVMEDIFHSADPFQAEGTRLDSIMASLQYPPRLVDETDADYRKRIFGTFEPEGSVTPSPASSAFNIRDDLEIKLSQIDGVTYAIVQINDTDTYDPELDLPGHSYRAVVRGGDDVEIAETIWSSHPGGITLIGEEQVEITDGTGKCRIVAFQRPVDVNIDIEYTVRLFQSSCGCDIPTDEELKQIAVDNLNSEDCPPQPGDDVRLSRVEAAIAVTPGVDLCSTRIARSGDALGTTNLELAGTELAIYDVANINVIIVESCP